MCLAGQIPAAPSNAADAVAMVQAGLGWLATTDVASLTTIEQADCLRGLERASSMHTAAQSQVLSAFCAQAGVLRRRAGLAADVVEVADPGDRRRGLRSRCAGGQAAGAAHPAVGDALAAGEISESWARQICDWTDKLPEDVRGDADVILLAAAAGGADLGRFGHARGRVAEAPGASRHRWG